MAVMVPRTLLLSSIPSPHIFLLAEEVALASLLFPPGLTLRDTIIFTAHHSDR